MNHKLSRKNTTSVTKKTTTLFYRLLQITLLSKLALLFQDRCQDRRLTCSLSFSSVSSSCTRWLSWAFFCFSWSASWHWASSSAIYTQSEKVVYRRFYCEKQSKDFELASLNYLWNVLCIKRGVILKTDTSNSKQTCSTLQNVSLQHQPSCSNSPHWLWN